MLVTGSDAVGLVLATALDAVSLRQRVTADNIANVDTPGFRATSVDFETSLRSAIEDGEFDADETVSVSTQPTLTPVGANGNNVDLRKETMAAMQSLMGTDFIFRYGSEPLRQRYLVPVLRGELVATFALTEPDAGSDVANITTRAERRGDGWVLRGAKTWVTSAPVADVITVAAKTSAERGMKNIALFLLDRRSMRGITLGKRIDKMAVRASETGEILLEDVEVPPEHLLGGETGGVERIGAILGEIRVMTSALSVGLARAAYAAALAYSRERMAFGKPIGEHQAIAFKLADMLTSLHAATLLTYQAAARLDAGRPVGREAAMAKLFASEMAVRVTDEAARVFASYGLAMEYPAQRYFRDARFLLPGGGTSEILRVIIGRELDWDRGQAFA